MGKAYSDGDGDSGGYGEDDGDGDGGGDGDSVRDGDGDGGDDDGKYTAHTTCPVGNEAQVFANKCPRGFIAFNDVKISLNDGDKARKERLFATHHL